MPTDTDTAALMLNPGQLGELLARLAAGSHGVTLCARVAGAQQAETGVALTLQDALLHLGPPPTGGHAPPPAPAKDA